MNVTTRLAKLLPRRHPQQLTPLLSRAAQKQAVSSRDVDRWLTAVRPGQEWLLVEALEHIGSTIKNVDRRRLIDFVESRGLAAPTEDNIEGPFYRAGAPLMVNGVLAPKGEPGTRLVLHGTVRDPQGAPLANALLDVWHADHTGAYSDDFHLRGQLRTDDQGRFCISTIVPGRYLNGAQYRPAHIHVKASAEGHAALTTQLYFDDDPYNAVDPFIRESLIMRPRPMAEGGVHSRFDFVLRPAGLA